MQPIGQAVLLRETGIARQMSSCIEYLRHGEKWAWHSACIYQAK